MKKGRGFTLVELLVVIAIIALLMSILMPALGRVRRQAKDVLDRSNQRQWAIIFGMFTEDNDGYFCDGANVLWTDAVRPYYQDPKMLCCPMATVPWRDGKRGTFAAWDMSKIWLGWGGAAPDDYGSYGLNEWLYNPPEEVELLWDSPTEDNWRNINVKGGSNIPMFLDCWWIGGGPIHKDSPPEYDGEIVDEGNLNDMKRFCLNRHDKAINGSFLDFSVSSGIEGTTQTLARRDGRYGWKNIQSVTEADRCTKKASLRRLAFLIVSRLKANY
jgi:prepilin-type N-terminal cleavage/methylation domain-containing protein